MLNISKYHRAIIGCSAIAAASLSSFVQSASAAEQLNTQAVRADKNTILIAQVAAPVSNSSNATGTGVTTAPIGITGSTTGNTSGSYSAGTISRAGAVQTRFSTAVSNYSNAKAAVSNASNQPTAVVSDPVRYARQVADVSTCGCPNADTTGSATGSTSTPSAALASAKAAEAEAAAELAAAQAEASKFIESVKSSSSAAGVSSPIW